MKAHILDELIVQAKPLFELCGTMLEAAAHGQAKPAATENMRQLILEGVEQVTQRAQALWPDGMEESRQAREECIAKLSKCGDKELMPLTTQWVLQFAGPVLGQFTHHLRAVFQITEETAKAARKMLEVVPFTRENFGRLLLEVGMKCEAWAPQLSWDYMMEAFEIVPDMMKHSNLAFAKDYVYQPDAVAQTELKACTVCGTEGEPFHAACSCYINSFEPMFLPAKLWMKCPKCGNLYSRYFPTEFLALGGQPKLLQPDLEQMQLRPGNTRELHRWSEILKKLCKHTSGRDLLEVGVGTGDLIAAAQELELEVTAVELLESVAQQTANLLELPIVCGDFLHLPEEKQYSILTMGDVLEHLQDPVRGLRKARTLLKDDGVLWLSTPNYESSFSRIQKVMDPMWREPFHITYFSRRSLVRLLSQVGFRVEEYTISDHYNGSMELVLKKAPPVEEASEEP